MHALQMNVTRTYHFMSEGIIIYLALLPFNFYHYGSVSLWAYLAVLFGTGFVYSFISRKISSYFPYIATIPFIFLLYFMLGYPMLLSIIFSGLFAWRYIAIQSKGFLGYESAYLSATLLLTILGIFLMREFDVVILFITQIMVIMVGFTISNLLVIEKEKQRAFHKTEWIKWGGIFFGSVAIIYLLSDRLIWITSKIWTGIGDGLTLFAGGIARLLEWLGLSGFFKTDINNTESIDEAPEIEIGETEGMFSFEPSEGDYFNLLLAISIGFIIVFLIFLIYRAMKFKVYEKDNGMSVGYTYIEEDVPNSGSFFNGIFNRKRVTPNHPIRKLVYEFERKTAKLNLGRMQHESIENWFDRIGLEGDIQIYQKVRYGDQSTSVEEEEMLKNTIKLFEKKLPKNTDNEE